MRITSPLVASTRQDIYGTLEGKWVAWIVTSKVYGLSKYAHREFNRKLSTFLKGDGSLKKNFIIHLREKRFKQKINNHELPANDCF